MFVRKVVNSSGNTAVQVVRKINRRNKIVKHLGTGKNQSELTELLKLGQQFIDQKRIKSGIISLFDNRFKKGELEKILSRLSFKKPTDRLTYDFLSSFYQKIGFAKLKDKCFKDLVIARIVQPESKRATARLLEARFNRKYPLNKIYETLRIADRSLYQQKAEEIVKDFVLQNITPKISILFFDVTTLYFETFSEDSFRRFGFSKDNKANQPQITVALTVTKYGIPLSFKSFEGNKFEGHTMLPVIFTLIKTFNLKKEEIVVVADSAMLRKDNLKLLSEKGLSYIVGARLGNLTDTIFKEVVKKAVKKDGETLRIPSSSNQVLVVSYSQKRAAKDKSDREKQVKKAAEILSRPQIVSSRYKFLTFQSGRYELNQTLIQKSKALEGLKGYVTNAINLTDKEIVQKYQELWQIEKAFRMSKSDLKARPVFHTLRESIEAHLLIVFVALAICRNIELVIGKSIATVVRALNQVKEIAVEDNLSHEKVLKSTELTKEAEEILRLAKSSGSPKK